MLGESFVTLPPVLRRFHELSDSEAHGILRVTRGSGRFRGFLADRLGLPSAAPRVPVHLHIQSDQEGETWSRRFATQFLVTHQRAEDGMLVESVGLYRFGAKLRVEAERLIFVFVRAWLGPLPLPNLFAIRIETTAAAHATADSWWIAVSVHAPLLGFLAGYEGEVTPDWKQH